MTPLQQLLKRLKIPKKTFPIAILGSLLISSILYIAVSGVLDGVLPYYVFKQTAAPVAFALNQLGIHWADIVISIGALCGITSVLLVSFFGQSRVFFAMSRDGLLPEFFSRLHKDFRTPTNGTIIVGIFASVLAAFLPITELAELVNIGTLAAFIIVSAAIIILRKQKPELKRPFKTPLVPVIPILAIVSCFFLVTQLPSITHIRFILWLIIGLFIYYFYGRKNSLLSGNK
ncbi:amino acid permease [Methanobacterium sp. SMA-27]|uniref:amino acid permease n=1 Tax=Methanobacterium sp. SMA-27 TaxID=1495336 RepID=UPI001E62F0C3|nr:amino acid permease [Methanobacterium sp. SMA-27]